MFIEDRINDNLVIYATAGGPAYNTTVVQVSSGRRKSNSNWIESLATFDIGERLCTISELEDILDFFNVAEGKANGFRFKDWGDYTVRPERGVFAQLTDTTFQLYKRYRRGANYKDKKISKPVAGTVRIYLDGAVLPTATVDTTTGIATIPGGYAIDRLSWSGEYDIPVAFTTDYVKHRFEAMSQDRTESLHYLFSLQVEEIRV